MGKKQVRFKCLAFCDKTRRSVVESSIRVHRSYCEVPGTENDSCSLDKEFLVVRRPQMPSL